MARRRLLAVSLALLATACTLGPDYERPPVTTPEAWRAAAAEEASLADIPWWDLFQDEQLRNLIQTALSENRDLKIAVERIEEARARYGISRSRLYPEIEGRAIAGGLKFSDGSLLVTPDAEGGDSTQVYNLALGLSWELDFFGRVRRANEAERANLYATEEARRAVTLTLVADVARAYFELRAFDRRLEIGRRTLEARREQIELARDRFEGGVAPELDLRQAEAEFLRVQSMIYELETLVAQTENEISYLAGHNPSAITRGRPVDQQPIPPSVPAGLPASLLERRPDVRQAEQQLIEANARIGEAKAALFPQISLTGALGLASTDLGDLIDSDSTSSNLFASLAQPIFNAGKNKRRVEVRRSQQRQALYGYERTILQAFREVEDALVALEKAGQQREARGSRVVALRKVYDLAELRYRGGVADYLEVLDAQRSLLDAEMSEVASIGNQVTSLVRLYQALGGGWGADGPPDDATVSTVAGDSRLESEHVPEGENPEDKENPQR